MVELTLENQLVRKGYPRTYAHIFKLAHIFKKCSSIPN